MILQGDLRMHIHKITHIILTFISLLYQLFSEHYNHICFFPPFFFCAQLCWKKDIALVQIISQSFPSLRFKTEHPYSVQPCSLRPNQSPCHRPSHSQQGLISHKASAVKPSRKEWGSPHWHPQPSFSQGTRGQDRITCSAHTHMHAQTHTHAHTHRHTEEWGGFTRT